MDIESIICTYFHLDVSILYSNDRHRGRLESEALHFVWYMRHSYEGLSYGTLAKIYNKTRRDVIFGTRKIASGIETQKYYYEKYLDIVKEAKRLSQEEKAFNKENI